MSRRKNDEGIIEFLLIATISVSCALLIYMVFAKDCL